MEKKEPIKVSLSLFFLIIAIIVICVMGFFIYKLNEDKNIVNNKNNELNNQIKLLETNNNSLTKTNENNSNDNKTLAENKNNEKYTYENISGYFTFNEKIPVDYGTYTSDTEAHRYLYLYENGMYFYESGLGSTNSIECGNYIIKDNNIILNRWFGETSYKNGKGLYLNEDINTLNGYKFTINSLNDISPELGFTNYPNVVMKRENNSELVKNAANKYEEKLKHDTLYNYSNTDMYTQPGQGQ